MMNINLHDENSRNKLGNTLKRLADAANKQGHAAFDAVPKDGLESGAEREHWKELQEQGRTGEFARSLSAEFGIEISEIYSNSDDPPDCHAKRADEKIGIEVTTLVKSDILGRVAQARKGNKDYSPEEQFSDGFWTQDELLNKIGELIAKKDASAQKEGKTFDVLLIYTDEDDLPPERLEDCLSNQKFVATNIKEVFLLRSFWPGYREHWPLFKLSVE